ncbi:MAG TPA: 3'-5' exonuclease, partial [Thermoanaerobaculia bacterium]|nr:3'-5' exonuclease [Thermoanaerobaculia bacterium]
NSESVSLWTIIEGDLGFLPPRATKAVREFREIVHDLQRAANHPLPEFFDYLLLRTGYRRMLQESRDVQDESRLENIEELLNSAREYAEQNQGGALGDYLDSITLISDLDRYTAEKGVTLMTLHAAKGLEFRIVFLAGMEEGVLPHSNSRDEQDDLEEERRLCYVGMTRAREQLYCLHALERRLHGKFREQSPSTFLEEIPYDVKEAVRIASTRYVPETPSWRERPIQRERWMPSTPPRQVARPAAPAPVKRVTESAQSIMSFFDGAKPVQFDPSALHATKPPAGPAAELKRGAKVRHEQFGVGTILTMEGSGPDAKLTVYFDGVGSKKFIAKFAKLTRA